MKACLRRSDGMTLVEVMITLGIASIMMLGVLEIVSLSNKATRNVTINADWSNFLASVRLAVSLEDNCKALLGGPDRYEWGATGLSPGVSPGIVDRSVPALDPPYPANSILKLSRTSPAMVVADSTRGANRYSSFELTSITITPQDSRLPPISQPMSYKIPGSVPLREETRFFDIYTAKMTLTGKKRTSAGSTPSLGGDILNSGFPIPITVVVGPTKMMDGSPIADTATDIFSCFASDKGGPEYACEMLGGTYKTVSVPHCYIPYFTAFDDDVQGTSPPTKGPAGELSSTSTPTSYPGGRIQLYGRSGFRNPRSSDYTIGYADQQMWFNIGGDHDTSRSSTFSTPSDSSVNAFVWTHVSDRDENTLATPLMALDRDGTLVLNPEGAAGSGLASGRATLGFAMGVGADATGTLEVPVPPSEKISSNIGLHTLELSTLNKARLVIRDQGEVVIGNADPLAAATPPSTISKLYFSNYAPGAMSFGATGTQGTFPRDRSASIQSNTADGSLEFWAVTSSGGTAQQRLTLQGNGTNLFNAGLRVKDPSPSDPARTSAVPYGCYWKQGGSQAVQFVSCDNPLTEVAVAGGVLCNADAGSSPLPVDGETLVVRDSYPRLDASNMARGWGGECYHTGDKRVSNPLYIYVHCCKQAP